MTPRPNRRTRRSGQGGARDATIRWAATGLAPVCHAPMTANDILIIEDDEIMRGLLAEWLAAAGYPVRVAAEGRAGLAAVRECPPALVITDIHMPVTGGTAVIAELKRTCPGLPLIAISGRFGCAGGLTPEGAVALGAAAAFAKPFKRSDLVAAVAALLRDLDPRNRSGMD